MLTLHDRSIRNLTNIFLESSLFACPRLAEKTKRALRFVLWEKRYRSISVQCNIMNFQLFPVVWSQEFYCLLYSALVAVDHAI